jgi:hypothetical protein
MAKMDVHDPAENQIPKPTETFLSEKTKRKERNQNRDLFGNDHDYWLDTLLYTVYKNVSSN